MVLQNLINRFCNFPNFPNFPIELRTCFIIWYMSQWKVGQAGAITFRKVLYFWKMSALMGASANATDRLPSHRRNLY